MTISQLLSIIRGSAWKLAAIALPVAAVTVIIVSYRPSHEELRYLTQCKLVAESITADLSLIDRWHISENILPHGHIVRVEFSDTTAPPQRAVMCLYSPVDQELLYLWIDDISVPVYYGVPDRSTLLNLRR